MPIPIWGCVLKSPLVSETYRVRSADAIKHPRIIGAHWRAVVADRARSLFMFPGNRGLERALMVAQEDDERIGMKNTQADHL